MPTEDENEKRLCMEKQCRGLNPWARQQVFGEYELVREEKVELTMGNGRKSMFWRRILESTVARIETGRTFSYAEGYDGTPVYRYQFADGHSWLEVIQEEATDELNYYLCLQDPDGNFIPESLWNPEQISTLQDQPEVPKEVRKV